MKRKKIKQTIYALIIFVLGVLAAAYIERINDWFFPKEIETVRLSKDTLFVIPISRKGNNSEKLETLRKESKYWKNIAKQNHINKEDFKKGIGDLKNAVLKSNKKPSNSLILNENTDLKKKISPKNDDSLNISRKNKSKYVEEIKENNYNDIFLNVNRIFKNKKGYQSTNMTNLFRGNCPDFKVEEKYFDLEFSIFNKNIFENSAAIFISMTGINEKNEHYSIYDEYYKPKMGVNKFQIKNVKNGKYKFTYGIILKQDLDEEFPKINGFDCTFLK